MLRLVCQSGLDRLQGDDRGDAPRLLRGEAGGHGGEGGDGGKGVEQYRVEAFEFVFEQGDLLPFADSGQVMEGKRFACLNFLFPFPKEGKDLDLVLAGNGFGQL